MENELRLIFTTQAWGGGILSHFLLGVPPPMLYSFHPSINYISVHLLVTLVFQIFPDASLSSCSEIALCNNGVGIASESQNFRHRSMAFGRSSEDELCYLAPWVAR